MDYTFQQGQVQDQQPYAGYTGWHQGGQGNAQGRKATPRKKSRKSKRDGGSHHGGPGGQQQGAPNAAAHMRSWPLTCILRCLRHRLCRRSSMLRHPLRLYRRDL